MTVKTTVKKRRERPGKRAATIDFDVAVYERVKSIAEREERDFGSQVRYIVQKFLEQLPPELKP